MKTCGIHASDSAGSACVNRSVHTVYIPNGNTAPQYSGSYRSGNRRYTCRQIPRITSIGIHQVAVDQNSRVKPLMNGINSLNSGERALCASSIVPASVEIATAPMLIQYGGARSEGLSVKNV